MPKRSYVRFWLQLKWEEMFIDIWQTCASLSSHCVCNSLSSNCTWAISASISSIRLVCAFLWLCSAVIFLYISFASFSFSSSCLAEKLKKIIRTLAGNFLSLLIRELLNLKPLNPRFDLHCTPTSVSLLLSSSCSQEIDSVCEPSIMFPWSFIQINNSRQLHYD